MKNQIEEPGRVPTWAPTWKLVVRPTTPAAHRAAVAVVSAFAFALGVRVKQEGEAATAIAKLIDRRAGVLQAADALRAGIEYAERVARLASAIGIEAEPPEVRQMRAALTELERE